MDIGLDYYLGQQEGLLHILAYYQMKDTMKRKILDRSKTNIVELNNIITIDSLFKDLYYKLIGEGTIIGNGELKHILRSLLEERNYKFFNHNSVDYIIEFIENVDSQLIDLGDYKEQPIIEELVAIYNHSKEELKKRGFIAKWTAYRLLLSRITKDDFKRVYPKVKKLFFDRLYIIRDVELELILKLSNWVEETVILLDYNPRKKKVFANLDPIVESLEKRGGFELIPKLNQDKRIIADVFSSSDKFMQEKYSWEKEMGRALELGSAKTKVDELSLIAQKIREIAKTDQPLSRIGVSFSTPTPYLPHLDRVFTQYGIPYNQTIEVPLLSSPLIQEFLILLSILGGDFLDKDLLALLSSKLIKFEWEDALVWSAEKLLKRIRFKAKGWELVDLLQKGLEEESSLKQGLEIIRERLEIDLDQKVGLKSFIDQLELLLNKSSLPQIIADSPNDKEISAAWKGLRSALETLANISSEELSKGEWLKVIRSAIEEGRYCPAKDEGVKVVGKIELRSGEFDHIFLVGMSHDLYPQVKKEPLHRYYNSLGIRVRNSQIDDRYLFFTNLLGGIKGVYITYSQAQGEDKAFSSLFINELKRVVDFKEMEVERDLITSKQELQKEFGSGLNEGKIYKLEDRGSWAEDMDLKFKLLEDSTAKELDNYNGVLKDEENVEWLKKKFYPKFNYSPSLLEDYLSCPFQFIFKRIFAIEDLDLDEDMDAMTRGIFLHQIMEEFYSRLEEKKVTEENYKKAKKVLLKVVQEEVEKYPLFKSNFYWQREKELYLKDGGLGVVLEEFLKEELQGKNLGYNKRSEFKVKETEWSFSDFQLVDGHYFTGTVDRIDYHLKEEALAVVDYKSGSLDNQSLAKHPLQLPLYALAVEKFFGQDIAYGTYSGLKKGDVRHKTVMNSKSSDKQREKFIEALEEAKELAAEAIRRIREGVFSPVNSDSCQYCSCSLICRREES